MVQRCSEYARIDGDTYVTPGWVWDVLNPVEDFRTAWDPAPVAYVEDFLTIKTMPHEMTDIATNPPFSMSDAFVRHALNLTHPVHGKVAMLLPHTWDTAHRRRDLFVPPFKAKYVLIKRIRWDNLEQKKNGPSTNHSWYIWDWNYRGTPTMGWLP